MNDVSFTTTVTVDATPDEAFAGINNVRAWWSGEISGSTDELGDEFIYRYGDLHCSTQRITESVPGARVVWRVLDAQLNFTQDTTEWTDTEIVFDISRTGTRTEVRFTHVGLVPQFECYDACSNAWASLIHTNLRTLLSPAPAHPDGA